VGGGPVGAAVPSWEHSLRRPHREDAFTIPSHRNETCLHLKLYGPFDGEAAQGLVNILKRRSRTISRVFIHAGSSREAHSLGMALFKEGCKALVGKSASLIFTGEHAEGLAPRRSTRI
jgi:phytoene dehydrogenase-like protein